MTKACGCFEKVNEHLSNHNGILEFNMLSAPHRAMVSVCKLHQHNRKKPPLMEATFCPFCGQKYPTAARDLARELWVSAR